MSQVTADRILETSTTTGTDTETRGQFAIMYAAISVNSLVDTYVFDSNWKTMDRTFLPMPVSLLKLIIHGGMMNESANFANAEAHRTAMLLSTTPETYDFSTGWTAVHV